LGVKRRAAPTDSDEIGTSGEAGEGVEKNQAPTVRHRGGVVSFGTEAETVWKWIMAKDTTSSDYWAVIYYDTEDECWVAHSLDTDQVGTGGRIVDALADLIRAVQALFELAKQDNSIALFRKAPPEIVAKIKKAKKLPGEVYEVAHRMVHGKWPSDVSLDVFPGETERPVCKTKMELTTI